MLSALGVCGWEIGSQPPKSPRQSLTQDANFLDKAVFLMRRRRRNLGSLIQR